MQNLVIGYIFQISLSLTGTIYFDEPFIIIDSPGSTVEIKSEPDGIITEDFFNEFDTSSPMVLSLAITRNVHEYHG